MAEANLQRSEADLVDWRRRQLRESGFPPLLAARLGRNPRFDLHAVIELVERGCPPDLAIRILAPLDNEAQ
jgi:hypothetical protein